MCQQNFGIESCRRTIGQLQMGTRQQVFDT
jgi:hypothetical protein